MQAVIERLISAQIDLKAAKDERANAIRAARAEGIGWNDIGAYMEMSVSTAQAILRRADLVAEIQKHIQSKRGEKK